LLPYAEALKAWDASRQRDPSRLLRGQVLQDALTWAEGKSLSSLDYQFLAASQTLEQREARNQLELPNIRQKKLIMSTGNDGNINFWNLDGTFLRVPSLTCLLP
jgi:hypothetical protein